MTNCKEYKLGELTTKITKGTTPSTIGNSFKEVGINFIKAEAVTKDGNIDSSKFTFIDNETNNKLRRSQLELNDILFSMAGVVLGKTAIVKREHLPANINQAVAMIRIDQSKANPYYVKYFLGQKQVFAFVNSSTAQSAQPNINLAEIGDLKIKLPDLLTQTAIAEILSSLDDKIELNNQINQELEALTQALFKQWFIDFEFPDANGQPYKSSGGDMVESELGEIPKGWEINKLRDVVTKSHTGADAITRAPIVDYDTGIKCVRVGDMTNKRPYQEWAYCKITPEDYARQKLDIDDIVVTRTATLGINQIVREEIAAVCNNGLIRLKINKQKCIPLFVYAQLQSEKTHIWRIKNIRTNNRNSIAEYGSNLRRPYRKGSNTGVHRLGLCIP
jgi:restriction endonuclease S subunit